MSLRQIHRYISLVFAALWVFQAATGCLIVFRWEMDDASVAGAHQPFSEAAFAARLDALAAQPGIDLSSVWSANAGADRFDIYYAKAGQDHALRVDGAGETLRDRTGDSLFDQLSALHMALMAGDTGRWFLGFSGIVLLSNIVLGLKLAWPRAGQWLKALRRPKGRAAPALLYGWHRTLGLWLAVPAAITIAAGVVLAFDGPLTGFFRADIAAPPAGAASERPVVRPSQALAAALGRYPGAQLSGFSFPSDDRPSYKVRLRARGEMPRFWGLTTVFVDARSGAVLSTYDARRPATFSRALLDTAYPLHTGQIGLLPGRLAQLLIGVWLMAMAGLGVGLWWKRKTLSVKGKS